MEIEIDWDWGIHFFNDDYIRVSDKNLIEFLKKPRQGIKYINKEYNLVPKRD